VKLPSTSWEKSTCESNYALLNFIFFQQLKRLETNSIVSISHAANLTTR